MSKCYLLSGWNSSGKQAIYEGLLNRENFYFIENIIHEDVEFIKNNNCVIDVYKNLLKEYDECHIIYMIRDPRIAWGVSEDRINKESFKYCTKNFFAVSNGLDQAIHRAISSGIKVNIIKFEDYLTIDKEEFFKSIDKDLVYRKNFTQPIPESKFFSKFDIETNSSLLFSFLYDFDSFLLVEELFKDLIKKYEYESKLDYFKIRSNILKYVDFNKTPHVLKLVERFIERIKMER
jgi:hypothetical protein